MTTPPTLSTLRLQKLAAGPDDITCSVKPCKDDLDEALQRLLSSGQLEASHIWSFPVPPGAPPAPNPLAVLHVLSGESGPDIRLLEWQGQDAEQGDPAIVLQARADFAKWYEADLQRGSCVVVRYPDRDKELVLVPVTIKTGGNKSAPSCAFWGFTVTANLLPTIASVLHKSKLVLVFDIDETLLLAHTLDSLQQKLQKIKAERKVKTAALETVKAGQPTSEVLQQLEAELEAIKLEQELLQNDFDMLNFFKTDPSCRVQVQGPAGPQMYEPSWETVTLAQGGTSVTRPVVRLELGGRPVYITRILPTVRGTSMLIRPRPGWEQLRNYIAGLTDLGTLGVKKDRWEVYVCTTADREYAWEAWRLLDPTGSMFPHQQLGWRMLCVTSPQKKDLLNVLRKREVDALPDLKGARRLASDPQFITDKVRASRPPLGHPVPLCVVIDDRLDVWEEDSRKAVLQVMPFHPHKEAATLDLGAQNAPAQAYQQALDSELELKRVQATIMHVRSSIYQTYDQCVKPEVQRLTSHGVSEALQSTASSILRYILQPLQSVPQLLADAPARPPAALGSTENDIRASDLRLLAHDGSMSSANGNGNGTSQQQQQQGTGVVNGAPAADPRKRRLDAALAWQPPAAAATGGPGLMGPPGNREQLGEPNQQQQQQEQPPPAKKQKKEKKKKALFGDIMDSLQRQPSEPQQQLDRMEMDRAEDGIKQEQQQQQGLGAAQGPQGAGGVPASSAAPAAAAAAGTAGIASQPSAAAAAAATSTLLADPLKSSSSSLGATTDTKAGPSSTNSAAGVPGLGSAAVLGFRGGPVGPPGLGPRPPQPPVGPPGLSTRLGAATGTTANPGTSIKGLAAAAAAAGTGMGTVPIKTEAAAAAAAAAAASSTEQQVLLGPLSQAFAAPAPSEAAMQLLMARLDGAAPNSPEADAALHKLLPQALRDGFAAEDVFELLAAMQLLLGGGGRRFEPAAVLAALPERLKPEVQRMAVVLTKPDSEAAKFVLPIINRPPAAVLVGSLAAVGLGLAQQQQQHVGGNQLPRQAPEAQPSAVPPPPPPAQQQQQQQQQQQHQHQQLLGLRAEAAQTATPPASPLGAGGVAVVDFRQMGSAQQQPPQQQQQQQAPSHGRAPGAPSTLQWHPMLQSVQGPTNQGGQLVFGSLGMQGAAGGLIPSRLSGPPSGGHQQLGAAMALAQQQQQPGSLQQQQQHGSLQQQQQQQQGIGPPPQQQQQQPPPGMFMSGPPSNPRPGTGEQFPPGFLQGPQGPQPGPGSVMMQGGAAGGPVYFMQGPGGAPMQLPPGVIMPRGPPMMQQPPPAAAAAGGTSGLTAQAQLFMQAYQQQQQQLKQAMEQQHQQRIQQLEEEERRENAQIQAMEMEAQQQQQQRIEQMQQGDAMLQQQMDALRQERQMLLGGRGPAGALQAGAFQQGQQQQQQQQPGAGGQMQAGQGAQGNQHRQGGGGKPWHRPAQGQGQGGHGRGQGRGQQQGGRGRHGGGRGQNNQRGRGRG